MHLPLSSAVVVLAALIPPDAIPALFAVALAELELRIRFPWPWVARRVVRASDPSYVSPAPYTFGDYFFVFSGVSVIAIVQAVYRKVRKNRSEREHRKTLWRKNPY